MRHPAGRAGFTLLEVIVTIVAAAIVGVIFIQFMGTAMSQSVRPLSFVAGEAEAERLLERVTADYVYEVNRDPEGALVTLKGLIDPPTRKYGEKVSAAWVAFDAGGNEIPYTGPAEAARTLKVTVGAAGHDLVALFTRSRTANSPPVAF